MPLSPRSSRHSRSSSTTSPPPGLHQTRQAHRSAHLSRLHRLLPARDVEEQRTRCAPPASRLAPSFEKFAANGRPAPAHRRGRQLVLPRYTQPERGPRTPPAVSSTWHCRSPASAAKLRLEPRRPLSPARCVVVPTFGGADHGKSIRASMGRVAEVGLTASTPQRCFRGSITRPARSLCTLRSRGRPRTTQHSIPAGGQP